MPNHVANEVIFRNVDATIQERILAAACDARGEVSFAILLPVPLNCWMGSVGKSHQETFPDNGLDWCRKNWSTKWDAYEHKPIERTEDCLTLRFNTAWQPPYGWLVAMFNKLSLPFEYNWLSEGEEHGHSGYFKRAQDVFGDVWKEARCDDEMQKHLHMLRWGCEAFPEEDDAEVVTDQQQTESR